MSGNETTGSNSRTESWADVVARLGDDTDQDLTGHDLATLADALFWLDRPAESATCWARAYEAHVRAGDDASACMAAWRAFYEHFLVGEHAVANGWLERLRRFARTHPATTEAGFVAVAESDRSLAMGDREAALATADRALHLGRQGGDDSRDLLAIALLVRGRVLIDVGRIDEGRTHLDEAMLLVVGGHLSTLITGWVYCGVLDMCRELADLRRAVEWTDAAMRWCTQLQEGALYPGLCRVHRVELACLRGDWANAEADAERASALLMSHDPRHAGEALYLVGEVLRLRGDLERAAAAYERAHRVGGRSPQPGLALVRLAEGDPAGAVTALRSALESAPSSPVVQARLLAALTDALLAAADLEVARDASDALRRLTSERDSPWLDAMADFADGTTLLALGQPGGALVVLRQARATFAELGLRLDAARAQAAVADAAWQLGDADGARLEHEAANEAFEQLGAPMHVRTTAPPHPAAESRHHHLTRREVEVLRLVARGDTNREVAAHLHISEHTVARHVSNIRTRLGVRTRAAAVAVAAEEGLI
jgi:DNA-binding NarL/FixJ family response regulator